jgi:hypothetical protein
MVQEFSTRLFYPNPFNPQGIEFDLPEDADVTIEIFTEEGKRVSNLVEKRTFTSGWHKITIPPESLQRGIYYFRLNAQGKSTAYTDTHTLFIE